jgi:coenzyme PQQ synthesis protein D (PqqD)
MPADNGSPVTRFPGGTPRQRPKLRALEINGAHTLCDEHGDAVCAMNEPALALWELCDGETAPEEMIDAICLLCGVDREVAAFDVGRTLQRLTNEGVLEWLTN